MMAFLLSFAMYVSLKGKASESQNLRGFLVGAEDEVRTHDPEITNHVLWPTEPHRQFGPFFKGDAKI